MRWTLLALANLAAAALTVPHLVGSGLGVPTWHHNASLVVSLAWTALALWLARRTLRRHAALGTAVWTTFALLSGFVLLYLKQDLKAWEYKDWLKFWHIAWSWLALWYAVVHTWINTQGWFRSTRIQFRHWWTGATYALPAIVILVTIPWTWSNWGADSLQEEQFIPLTLWTWLASLVVSYGLWVAWRLRWIGPSLDRVHVQNWVGSWLIPITLLANVSGLPLLYFDTKSTSLKYIAKYWHVWPSIVMAILVFAHTIHFLPGLQRYLQADRP